MFGFSQLLRRLLEETFQYGFRIARHRGVNAKHQIRIERNRVSKTSAFPNWSLGTRGLNKERRFITAVVIGSAICKSPLLELR
jgi:hypothetical protein